jgi:glyoxylase-like metal-dependent hydrolase (beta-lactamase superfamily II)
MGKQEDGLLPEPTGGTPSASRFEAEQSLADILSRALRIPNDTGWFEIIELPNQVYAFWEPGHAEEVNAFLIVGTERDVLYDTGMGIASIGRALADLRDAEGWPGRELMVINSHNHLDHNGGNTDFDEAWIIEDEWAIRKLTEGIPSAGDFVAYWDQLKDHPGVEAPTGFDPTTFRIPPFPRESIRFLSDGDIVDLGNRRFRVIHTTSHSPDGLALYDEEHAILFGGDTFIGDEFLVRDLDLLVQDLLIARDLDVEWHYCSHGPQLIEVMRSGYHLSIIRRMIRGEREEGETTFAGNVFPLYELDGVAVTLAPEFLTY